jgi:hypothetical protein
MNSVTGKSVPVNIDRPKPVVSHLQELTCQLCREEYTLKYCHFGAYKYMHTDGRSTMHAMVRFCVRSCRCMSSLRGGPPALKQLRRAHCYAKMADLPPPISHAPEGPRDVRHAKLHRLERLRRMVAVQRRGLLGPR